MTIQYDSLYNPYPSRRMTTYAKRGMVATSHPIAAQVGLDILKKGGNAIDAAIATAASLTVLEPASNGIGGDAFALVWFKGELFGLNASGPAPKNISIEAVKARGFERMPKHGLIPVTVPGAPGAWAALAERFGKLPLTQILAPAIEYAEQGYALTPAIGNYWRKSYLEFREILKSPEFEPCFDTFAPGGRTPQIGEVWSSPAHAKTLQLIAESNAESFYRGELAEKIDEFSKKHGGFIAGEDLADFTPDWVSPIKINYRGYDVWEIPPNGQGLVALMALNILKGFEFSARDSVETCHKQIEAMKLAFEDGLRHITDAQKMQISVENLMNEAYADERRSLISETAYLPQGKPLKGGTVYLAAADQEGNMVSYIQSNFDDFGSGIVIPGTGINLQNRGGSFSLDASHANALEPGKKTYHTIIPGFLTRGSEPVGPFGVMGAFMQPQGHVQVVMNTVDFHLNPQAALDAPRWQWVNDKKIMVEPNFPNHLAQALDRKGHEVIRGLDPYGFGRGQIIWRDNKTGVLAGGTDPRTDGIVAAW